MSNSTKTRLQILPGSAPGKLRIVGDKADAEVWIPRIQADRAKLREVTAAANELVHLIVMVGQFYEFTPEEIHAAFFLAARDPDGALVSYRETARRLRAAGDLP